MRKLFFVRSDGKGTKPLTFSYDDSIAQLGITSLAHMSDVPPLPTAGLVLSVATKGPQPVIVPPGAFQGLTHEIGSSDSILYCQTTLTIVKVTTSMPLAHPFVPSLSALGPPACPRPERWSNIPSCSLVPKPTTSSDRQHADSRSWPGSLNH